MRLSLSDIVYTRRAQNFALCSLVLTSLYLNFSLLRDVINAVTTAQQPSLSSVRHGGSDSEYTYVGSDYPPLLPIERKFVKMEVEESVRYSLTDPESELEWLWTGPVGDHHVRLGESRRAFAVPMFHQLHCLRTIRELIDRGGLRRFPRAYGHVHHCFIYLRQWTLCSADVTLEPGDFMQRNFTLERIGATHTCQDWEPAYEMVGDNWKEWERYREAHGLPDPLD